jgi:hypothetical protein
MVFDYQPLNKYPTKLVGYYENIPIFVVLIQAITQNTSSHASVYSSKE